MLYYNIILELEVYLILFIIILILEIMLDHYI